MCVCSCVCRCVYAIICVQLQYVWVQVHVYRCVCAGTCICKSIYECRCGCAIMCVQVHTCVSSYVSAGACVCMCGAQGTTPGVIPQVPSTLITFLRQGLLLGLKLLIQLNCMATEPQGSSCLCLLRNDGLQTCPTTPSFFFLSPLFTWVLGIELRASPSQSKHLTT